MSDEADELDTALELCRAKHRRIILATLLQEQRVLPLNDLTKEIVKHNHHASIAEVPSEKVNQTQISLFHQHIPKLLDAKVITYDQERQLVEPTERLDGLRPSLSTIIELDPDLEIPNID